MDSDDWNAEELAALDAAESEARQLGEEATAARKRAAACDVEAKKATHAAARLKTEAANAARRVESLTEKHTWIPHEKGFFGCAGGDYDFAAREGGAARARADLDKLERAQDKLARKINKRVMGMIEKAEREYDDLNTKKGTVARDKAKIEAVIGELDVKKQETLEATWRKVNHDFGSIFSSLLPGASAKLEPPAGLTVLDGLEVKVAFGNLWKDSLSELSGGQRSLVALSLDGIEHGILRKRYKDARVHYAVNCASVGCPDLAPRAYTGGALEAMLEEGARGYINTPRGVRVEGAGIRASKIYSWFSEDFGSEAQLRAHWRRYARPDLAAAIEGARRIAGYDYDWSLNDAG